MTQYRIPAREILVADVFVDEGGPLHGATVAEIRPQSREYPMSIQVRVGSDWHTLPAEGAFEVERA